MVKSRVRPLRTNIRQKSARAKGEWASLRLRDRIGPGLRVLFVGINPGVRSAITGHHFAGYSNRFWKLLCEAQLVPERITYLDDDRLAEWGYGITNLVPRPSPGIDDLRPAEYTDGWTALERKIRRFTPGIVAFVGVTLYRAIRPLLASEQWHRPRVAFRRWPSGFGPRRSMVRECSCFRTRAAGMPTSVTRRC